MTASVLTRPWHRAAARALAALPPLSVEQRPDPPAAVDGAALLSRALVPRGGTSASDATVDMLSLGCSGCACSSGMAIWEGQRCMVRGVRVTGSLVQRVTRGFGLGVPLCSFACTPTRRSPLATSRVHTSTGSLTTS